MKIKNDNLIKNGGNQFSEEICLRGLTSLDGEWPKWENDDKTASYLLMYT